MEGARVRMGLPFYRRAHGGRPASQARRDALTLPHAMAEHTRTPARSAARRAAGAWPAAGWRRPGAARLQPNPNAMVLATATPDGQPFRTRGAVQGHRARSRASSCSTRTTSRAKGSELSGQPARGGRHALGSPAPPGAGGGPHREGARRGQRRATSPRAPGRSRVGAWASAAERSRSPRAPTLLEVGGRHRRALRHPGARRRARMSAWTTRCRARRTGAAYRLWAEAVELWVEGDARMHDRARWTRDAHAARRTASSRRGPWSATRLQP